MCLLIRIVYINFNKEFEIKELSVLEIGIFEYCKYLFDYLFVQFL